MGERVGGQTGGDVVPVRFVSVESGQNALVGRKREGDGGDCVKKKELGGNMTEKLWQKEGKCEI